MIQDEFQIENEIKNILRKIENISTILQEFNKLGNSPTLLNLNNNNKFPLGETLVEYVEFINNVKKINNNYDKSILLDIEEKWEKFQNMINVHQTNIIKIINIEVDHDLDILENRVKYLANMEPEVMGDTFFIRSITYENMKLLKRLKKIYSKYEERILKIDNIIKTTPNELFPFNNNAPKEYWWYHLNKIEDID